LGGGAGPPGPPLSTPVIVDRYQKFKTRERSGNYYSLSIMSGSADSDRHSVVAIVQQLA